MLTAYITNPLIRHFSITIILINPLFMYVLNMYIIYTYKIIYIDGGDLHFREILYESCICSTYLETRTRKIILEVEVLIINFLDSTKKILFIIMGLCKIFVAYSSNNIYIKFDFVAINCNIGLIINTHN